MSAVATPSRPSDMSVQRTSPFNELTPEQVREYHEKGFLRIPQMFTAEEIDAMSDDLDWLIDVWATKDQGWTGPWRKQYMDAATEKKSKLIALHDLQYYSGPWARAVTKHKLAAAMADLLGTVDAPSDVVAFHHSTLHVKPPETGHPFPMHQDWAFYKHANDRYVDVLVHLDDTRHENGEIRFLAGSHKLGKLDHVVKDEEGKGCTPHLPFKDYRLEDTVAVPAKRGDVVVFNILTIHGSYVNTTERNRRLVRVGYKHPDNEQFDGQSKGRPGWTVWGRRQRHGDEPAFHGA
jgi:phytanoyl-CoA hydroxylase